jgi:hypothetical protein
VAWSTDGPTAFNAASAATTVPSGSTALAVPSPPLRSAFIAPAPAPTLPDSKDVLAAVAASTPNAAVGRQPKSPPRPRSNSAAVGTSGSSVPSQAWTPSAAARP